MPEPKAQLVDPQGPIDVPGLSVTGVTTATGGFVGQVQGTATGLASTTANLSVGIVTATKFKGNTTGNVSGLADDTNINVGIITSTSFTGDLVGNAAGLSTTTANIKAGIMSATSFAGNFTGVASGITGTPNIVVGIMTGTLKGDGSGLTGIAATNWITNNVTANSSTTAIDLALGNVVKFTQSANTTVSFANTGTSNIVTFIRADGSGTITWPSAIKWDGGSAPTLNSNSLTDYQLFKLLTRDEGVTWYGWEDVKSDPVKSLYAWGYNSVGGLGLNDIVARSSPTQIGSDTTWNYINGSPPGSSMSAIKTDGTLWVWGDNGDGVLGLNSANPDRRSSPVQIPGTSWASVALGGQNGYGIKTDGTLWSWGYNGKGSLGLNQSPPTVFRLSSPTQVPAATNWSTTLGYLSAGERSVLAVKTDGTLWSWGNCYMGVGGWNDGSCFGISSPTQIPGTNWAYTNSQNHKATAIKTDGTLWSWGYAANGGLGLNDTVHRSSPTQIPGTNWAVGLNKFNTHIYAGAAIKTDGTLWTWGWNGYGQLGNNNKTTYSSPIQVPGTDWDTVKITSYGYSMIAVKTDNTLWTWGRNYFGALGQNQTHNQQNRSSPIQIPGKWSSTTLSSTANSPFAMKMSG
jgi:alpha-tubulin suppressor-like RCC1 family protein